MGNLVLTQMTLTIALGVLVVILACLLLLQVQSNRRGRSQSTPVDEGAFVELFDTDGKGITIPAIAGRMSELLKTRFGCERIVFLRKHRGALELNYYHGIRRFNRNDFGMRSTEELARAVRQGYEPRDTSEIMARLPKLLQVQLREHELGLFFPIAWGENLYGIYFVKSDELQRSNVTRTRVATMARLLSIAYHTRWHEARLERFAQRNREPQSQASDAREMISEHRLLKLVRHRQSETLVPSLLETLQHELGATRLLYYYQGSRGSDPVLTLRSGVGGGSETDSSAFFEDLSLELDDSSLKTVQQVRSSKQEVVEWVSRVERAGLRYIVSLPLSENRKGVLLFTSEKPAADLRRNVEQFRVSMRELYSNAELFGQMEEMSYTDSLTGLFNQRYFQKRLTEEIDRARRYGRSLALIMFDLDQLKAINDGYGHQAGDAMLKQMGQVLRSSVRAIDVIARYGGDEFCIIMPEADRGTCTRFMQRFHAKITSSPYRVEGINERVDCTISLGGAVFPDHAADPDRLIFAADMAMLRAKESGRNTYVLYDSLVASG